MRWQTLKTVPRDLLAGVTIETEYEDGNLRIVVLTDASGKRLRLTKPESYSSNLAASVPAEPETVERWRLSGQLNGAPVVALYEAEYEAKNAASSLDEVQIERVKVPVDDAGEPAPADEAIPF